MPASIPARARRAALLLLVVQLSGRAEDMGDRIDEVEASYLAGAT